MTRQRCTQCDALMESDAPFCPACGTRVPGAPAFDDFDAEITRTEIQLQSPQLRARREPVGKQRARRPALNTERSSSVRTLLIGRDHSCDIVLDAPQISRRHVSLTPLGPERWLARDLGTANGTYLGDRQRRLTQTEVGQDDVLFLGSYRFPLSRLKEFTRRSASPRSGSRLSLPPDKAVITLGRGPANDIVLQSPQVSRHHARLVRESGGLFLEDLSSANGTFVGGQRIRRAPIEHDQIFSLGSFALRLDLEKMRLQKSYRGDILLQAENLRIEVPTPQGTRRLLDGVSFTVYPTEIVGLLGPSGAGKTTLLNALIAYTRPSFGRTLLNGDEIFAHYDRYRGAIGYVPQEDIIHSELTVYQSLYYTAKLRLPPDTTDQEIDQRIWQVLHDLEIAQTADLRIGSPEQKGISGGQRKRVNLAMELLTDPSLLCLDEPTSGLASEDALNVMQLLRRLADRGKTILLTIHQPSLKAYRLMDNTLYLADGEQVYYGPAFPDSMLYFNPEVEADSEAAEQLLSDPGSCMRPLVAAARAGEPMETFAARYRQSGYFEEFVAARRRASEEVHLSVDARRKPPTFELRQLRTLTHRYLTIKLKDRVGTLILLIQAPIVALLLNLVFFQDEGGVFTRMEHTPLALFLLVISAIWFGGSNAAREIVGEQAIYRRERMVNLSISAYVTSKFVVLGFFCLIQCVALLALTYGPLGFHGNPLVHLLTLWLCALAGLAIGLLLSAAVRTSEAAIALVPIVLIPQVILGGAIMPVERMDTLTRALSATTFSRSGFEAMIHTEDRALAYEIALDELPVATAEMPVVLPLMPHPLDRFFGEAQAGHLLNLGALGGFTVVLLGGVALTLRRRDMD
ncbi:FHA domain-containing protein [Bradymonadaceae bacterium TMQ3]|nr:FHA domain-containing protein [Bradymonadaceae bacterium TMQ3]TXC75186.1 FHA domain-containing protein [Bradymonadales bacterium TMQ1]